MNPKIYLENHGQHGQPWLTKRKMIHRALKTKTVAHHGYMDRTLKTMINYRKITIDKRHHENQSPIIGYTKAQ